MIFETAYRFSICFFFRISRRHLSYQAAAVKPALQFSHAKQIVNHHYLFLLKLITYAVCKHVA